MSGGSRRPKWKDEAAKWAAKSAAWFHGVTKALTKAQWTKVEAAADAHVFDEKAFFKNVTEATAPGASSTSVKIMEGA